MNEELTPNESEDIEDNDLFNPCDRCDGHPACEDFGCAYQLGLGKMVEKNTRLTSDDL